MKAKRMLSLVMAAVLALCVLAGCRGGRALSQVMAGLLEGQYQNVAVEADPDTAARKAFADWDAALARLPSDGQYAAEIAMVEAEGGYYIAVDVKIVKAGKPDTDDDAEEVGDGAQHNESANAGAVAGENRGIVSGCTVTASGKISASATITYAYAGGVVGDNDNGTVNGSCKLNDGKIEAKVGENIATVTEGDKDGTETAGNVAYAGIKIGYEPAPRPLPPEVPGT